MKHNDSSSAYKKENDEYYSNLVSLYQDAKDTRQAVEGDWYSLYRLYTGYTTLNQSVGNNSWTTSISCGKSYELVETLVSYLTRTFFFATKWFDLKPSSIAVDGYKPILLTLLADMLAESNFYSVVAECFRQLPLTGVTGIVTRMDGIGLSFESISAFNLYLTKDDRCFFHREVYTKGQLWQQWKYLALYSDNETTNSVNSWDDLLAVAKLSTDALNSGILNTSNQKTSDINEEMYELISCYTYCYKAKMYKRVVFCGSTIVACITRLKEYDIPIVMTLNKLPDNIYGIPLLAPSVGLIAEQESLRNYRLSNSKLGSYMMFVAGEDDILPEQLSFAPGKVFKARDVKNLTPLQIPDNTNVLTTQEAEMIDRSIYQNIGLGAGTSANVARQGERVTASEIESLKQASGIRLNQLFVIVESNFVSPLLNAIIGKIKSYNGKRKVIVKQFDDTYNLYNVAYSLLDNFDVTLSANGVRERLESVQRLIDLLGLVGQSEAFAASINIESIVLDIVKLYGFDNPEKYIKQQQATPTAPEQPKMSASAEKYGMEPQDNGVIQAMLAQAQTDPSVQALRFTETPNDPEVISGLAQQQAEQEMLSQQGMVM